MTQVFFLCVILSALSIGPGYTKVELPEVHLNDNADFVDPQGRILLFHGFNSVYKKPPYFNAKDVDDIRLQHFRSWGFNVVRLGVLWHPSFPQGPGKLNGTYLKSIERQVDRFANAGLYVIVDMHQDSLSSMFGSYDAIPLWLLESFSKPPWFLKYPWPRKTPAAGDWQGYTTYACQKAFQDIYNNKSMAWNHWGDFWVEVATRLKSRSNVLGYELMNEPFAGNIYTNPLRGIPGYADRKNLAPVYDYLVRRIRSVDRKKLIFFEGVTWSVESSGEFAGPGFKHVPGGLDDPSEFKRSVFSYHYYCQLIEFANFSREFGTCVPDGNPASMNTIECNTIMNAADAHFQSWAYWNALFFDDADKPILKQVKPFVRMYPMTTAGAPMNLTFDTVTGKGFYAFTTTAVTVNLAKRGEAIASVYMPLELYYQHGFSFKISPSTFNYKISQENDHLFNLFGPSKGITEGVLVRVDISAQ